MKYLRFFHDCPYILDIIDFYCYPYVSSANLERYTRGMRYIYMVTPLYDYDLESVIDASNVYLKNLFVTTSICLLIKSVSFSTKSC